MSSFNLQNLYYLLLAILITAAAGADNKIGETSEKKYTLNRISTTSRFTFDQVDMPDNDEPMGLLGLYFDYPLPYHLYSSIAGFGGLTGNQGGLFVLGIEGGFDYPLGDRLSMSGGYFFGGGGGKVWTGDGEMRRYFLGLNYSAHEFRAGLHVGRIVFPTSDIAGTQLGLNAAIPVPITVGSADYLNHEISDLRGLKISGSNGKSIQRFTLAVMHEQYFQKAGTLDISGQPQDDIIGLIGFAISKPLIKNIHLRLKLAGAYSGIHHGYMDVLGGLRYRLPLIGSITLIAGIDLGMGGGGHVETGGGLLLGVSVGAQLVLGPRLRISAGSGLLNSPDGNLHAKTLTFQAGYRLDLLQGTSSHRQLSEKGDYRFSGWAIRIADQIYQRPQRKSSINPDNVRLIGVKIDRRLNHCFYLTGQSFFAFSGKHVGGLAVGLVGAGITHPPLIRNRISLYAEALAGAAGGGHLALGEGAIIQWMYGLNLHFSDQAIFSLSTGQVGALRNELDSVVIELSYSIRFSLLLRKIQ